MMRRLALGLTVVAGAFFLILATGESAFASHGGRQERWDAAAAVCAQLGPGTAACMAALGPRPGEYGRGPATDVVRYDWGQGPINGKVTQGFNERTLVYGPNAGRGGNITVSPSQGVSATFAGACQGFPFPPDYNCAYVDLTVADNAPVGNRTFSMQESGHNETTTWTLEIVGHRSHGVREFARISNSPIAPGQAAQYRVRMWTQGYPSGQLPAFQCKLVKVGSPASNPVTRNLMPGGYTLTSFEDTNGRGTNIETTLYWIPGPDDVGTWRVARNFDQDDPDVDRRIEAGRTDGCQAIVEEGRAALFNLPGDTFRVAIPTGDPRFPRQPSRDRLANQPQIERVHPSVTLSFSQASPVRKNEAVKATATVKNPPRLLTGQLTTQYQFLIWNESDTVTSGVQNGRTWALPTGQPGTYQVMVIATFGSTAGPDFRDYAISERMTFVVRP